MLHNFFFQNGNNFSDLENNFDSREDIHRQAQGLRAHVAFRQGHCESRLFIVTQYYTLHL